MFLLCGMEHLVSIAMGIPFCGQAFPLVEGALLQGGRRLYTGKLTRCDVYQGYRNRARKTRCRQWDQGPNGFIRRADPCLPGPFVFYGWQAPPVPGGACGGLHYPHGLADHFALKVRLRRIRSLLEHAPFCLHYKVGVLAPCGYLGSRLVRPKIWLPLPAECLQMYRTLSRNERFWNVELRWVKATALKLLAYWLGQWMYRAAEAEAFLLAL
ncbi:MAG: hypothetical protein WBB32_01840 [Flavobacteriales bacterium]